MAPGAWVLGTDFGLCHIEQILYFLFLFILLNVLLNTLLLMFYKSIPLNIQANVADRTLTFAFPETFKC